MSFVHQGQILNAEILSLSCKNSLAKCLTAYLFPYKLWPGKMRIFSFSRYLALDFLPIRFLLHLVEILWIFCYFLVLVSEIPKTPDDVCFNTAEIIRLKTLKVLFFTGSKYLITIVFKTNCWEILSFQNVWCQIQRSK